MLSPRVPELSALQLLLTVATEGSLGRAAVAHGISQPAVSSRIQGIERLLGFPLLERGARGSTLTTRGALVAEWAHNVVNAAEAFAAAVESLRADSQARLNVAASLTIAEHLLPTWLTRWHSREPDVVINLMAVNSAETARLVLDGQADLGFVEGPTIPTGLSSRVVARDRLAVVVAPHHPWTRRRSPITGAELAETRLVQREAASGTRTALEAALSQFAPFATPALELSTSSAVRGAAIAGAGPAVLSLLAVADDLSQQRLIEIPVAGVDFTRKLRAIWPRGQQLAGPARDLLTMITRVPFATA